MYNKIYLLELIFTKCDQHYFIHKHNNNYLFLVYIYFYFYGKTTNLMIEFSSFRGGLNSVSRRSHAVYVCLATTIDLY